MREKTYKKEASKLFESFGLTYDESDKKAYEILILARDLSVFKNISHKQALSELGLDEKLSSLALGNIEGEETVGIKL